MDEHRVVSYLVIPFGKQRVALIDFPAILIKLTAESLVSFPA